MPLAFEVGVCPPHCQNIPNPPGWGLGSMCATLLSRAERGNRAVWRRLRGRSPKRWDAPARTAQWLCAENGVNAHHTHNTKRPHDQTPEDAGIAALCACGNENPATPPKGEDAVEGGNRQAVKRSAAGDERRSEPEWMSLVAAGRCRSSRPGPAHAEAHLSTVRGAMGWAKVGGGVGGG